MSYTVEALTCPCCHYQTLGDDKFGIPHFIGGSKILCKISTGFTRTQCTHRCKDCGAYGVKPQVWLTWHYRPDGQGMCDAGKGLNWEELVPPAESDFEDEAPVEQEVKIKFREFL